MLPKMGVPGTTGARRDAGTSAVVVTLASIASGRGEPPLASDFQGLVRASTGTLAVLGDCSAEGARPSSMTPSFPKRRMTGQVGSISNQRAPKLGDMARAWWLF